jgi:putative FmdB family regulatory protein
MHHDGDQYDEANQVIKRPRENHLDWPSLPTRGAGVASRHIAQFHQYAQNRGWRCLHLRKDARGVKMPIYEYECDKCHRRSSVLTLRVSQKVDAKCEHCGATQMRRLMSRFAMPRSEEARLDALADPSTLGDFDENDPKSLARVIRKMGREMGDEFAGPEFDEAVNEIESNGDIGGDGDSDDD